MPATKATTVLFNNVTLTAGAGDQTADVTIDAGYGALLGIKLTNGATGPANAARVQIQQSNDGVNFFDFGGSLEGSVSNGAVRSWSIDIPMAAQRIRVIAGGNTSQNVTVRVEISNGTAL